MKNGNGGSTENPFQMVERVKGEIRQLVNDPEAATSLERKMWRDVLTFIAMNAIAEPDRLARAALETVQWDFKRWS